jgi:hypothetical protein
MQSYKLSIYQVTEAKTRKGKNGRKTEGSRPSASFHLGIDDRVYFSKLVLFFISWLLEVQLVYIGLY